MKSYRKTAWTRSLRSALVAIISIVTISSGAIAAENGRTYIYATQLQGHPYLLDNFIGIKHAVQKFGVTVDIIGPQGWDPVAGAAAVEQAIARQPDGIITTLWEPGAIPGIKRAMAQGIPVIVIEAIMPDSGALTFIGLDNYEAGVDTAKELIKRGGNSGSFVASGNWGASNTDAKFKGLVEYLKENSDWKLAGRIDDKANTVAAIDAAKAMFNTYPDITAVVGLDSSSGTGICLAAEELDKDISGMTIIVHDREDPVLECIEDGAIDASIVNKTALEAYMAVQMLEAYNDANIGLASVPISSDNVSAKVIPFPQFIYMGTAVIDSKNVKLFQRSNLPTYK